MLDFITTHWLSIVVVLAFIALVVFLAVRGKKDIIYKMLYALVTEAEKQYGAGTGSVKFAEVMTRVYGMLPAVVKVFITYSTLSKWIEDALEKAKKDWAEKGGIVEPSNTEN